MKVFKKISVQGEWAKIGEDINNGDVIKILDEGKIVAGDYGDRNVFKIETKNGDKNLSFNQTTMNYVIDGFGDDTSKWTGKEVKVWIIKSNIQGKWKNVVYLASPDWIEGEDGLCPPNTKGNKEEKIEYPDGEVNPEEIPF